MNIKKTKLSEFEKLEILKKEDTLYNIYRVDFIELQNDAGIIKIVPIKKNHSSGKYQDLLTGKVYTFVSYYNFKELETDYSSTSNYKTINTYSFTRLSDKILNSTYKYFTIKGDTAQRAKMQAYLEQSLNDLLYSGHITNKQGIENYVNKLSNILTKITPTIKKYDEVHNKVSSELLNKIDESEKEIW